MLAMQHGVLSPTQSYTEARQDQMLVADGESSLPRLVYLDADRSKSDMSIWLRAYLCLLSSSP